MRQYDIQMISLEQFECLTPTAAAVKEEVLYCSTNATNAVELWSTAGTCAAAVFAALAAFIAYRVFKNDKKRYRQKEVRDATVTLLSSIHYLAVQSKDSKRNNEADRRVMYQTSVAFEMIVGTTIDRDRFNAGINWILKASALTAKEYAKGNSWNDHRGPCTKFLDELVREMTECLRTFDAHQGKRDLTPDMAQRFKSVFCKSEYFDAEVFLIPRTLTKEANYYKRLVLEDMPSEPTA